MQTEGLAGEFARRAAVIDPPYPEPITMKSYEDLRSFQLLRSGGFDGIC
jgi:hypothetical protein